MLYHIFVITISSIHASIEMLNKPNRFHARPCVSALMQSSMETIRLLQTASSCLVASA